jgi:PKD repeat protein
MKLPLRFLILITLFFTFITPAAYASHMMGAELTYTCLGSDKYEITVKVFRDCNGITVANTPLTVTPLTSGITFTSSLTQMTIRDVTRLCSPSFQSKCAGGTYQYGIEEYIYIDTIDLSSYTTNCKFRISWEQSARASSISTGMADQNFFIETLLDKCLSSCNSSPKFTTPPVAILCAGQDYCYKHEVTDPDGDTLTFSLVDPLQYAGNPVTYSGSFNKKAPLTFLGFPTTNAPLPSGFHLDSISGELCFRPSQSQIAVVAVKVTEWRTINGVRTNVGEITRDMEYIITTCSQTNSVPNFTGPSSYDVCAGSQLCFTIQSSDSNSADSVRVGWSKPIAGATFTPSFPTGSKKGMATFCWTPTNSDVGVKTFIAIVKDNACPLPGVRTKVYTVTVKPKLNGANRVYTKTGCGRVLFDAVPLDAGQSKYLWTIRQGGNIYAVDSQQTYTQSFPSGGRYIIDLDVNRVGYCGIKFRDTLDVDTFLTVNLPPDTSVCAGTSILIGSQAASGVLPYRYQWSSGLSDTLPQVNITAIANATYILTVTDSLNCAISDSINVTARVAPSNAGVDKKVCISGGVQALTGLPSGGSWSGNAVSGNDFDPALAGAGVHKLQYFYTDSTGCSAIDEMNFEVLADPVVSAGSDMSTCKDQTVMLLSGTPANGSWSGPGVTSGLFDPASLGTGFYDLIYTYTDANGCSANDSMEMEVNTLPVVNAGQDTSLCENAGSFNLSGTPAGGSWSGQGTSGNTFDPKGLSGIKTITYSYTDNKGCSNTDERDVLVNSLPLVNAGSDISVCLDGGAVTLTGTPSNGTWVGMGVNTGMFNPALTGVGTFKAWLITVNANGCASADTLLIHVVKPVADFSATPLSGARPLNVAFTDLSTGTYQKLEWNFGDAAGSQNTSVLQNPSHVYHFSGTYSVTLIITDTTTNCSDTMSRANYISVGPGVGLTEILEGGGIYAYPNPASKVFNLQLQLPAGENFNLQMFNVTGKKIREMKRLESGTTLVNCEELEPGIYFIEVAGNRSSMFRSKIVLQ